MLYARQRLLNGAFRRMPVNVPDMAGIRHPIVEVLPRINPIAAIAHKLDEMSHLDFIPLPAVVLDVAVQQRGPEGLQWTRPRSVRFAQTLPPLPIVARSLFDAGFGSC